MPELTSLTITRVQLRVASLARALAFYRDLLGFRADGGALSAAPGGPVLIELLKDPTAPPRPPRSAGLYHIAIRVPDRPALAALLRRLAESRWPRKAPPTTWSATPSTWPTQTGTASS